MPEKDYRFELRWLDIKGRLHKGRSVTSIPERKVNDAGSQLTDESDGETPSLDVSWFTRSRGERSRTRDMTPLGARSGSREVTPGRRESRRKEIKGGSRSKSPLPAKYLLWCNNVNRADGVKK